MPIMLKSDTAQSEQSVKIMSIFIIILISIYVLSIAFCWNWMRIAYSSGGVDEDKKVTVGDFVVAILPAVNTLVACIVWTTQNPRKDGVKLTTKWLHIIFCVKRKDEE